MSEVILYEYKTTPDGSGVYKVSSNPDTPVAVVTQILSNGDEFVVGGKIYQYIGGADSGGTEVGFFATAPNGSVHFFATSPIPPGTETLTLNASQSFDTICFMAGTLVATPDGAVAIEELVIGDVVLTAEGREAPVKWVGRQTISGLFADPNRVMPIRIKAGALDDNMPTRDLLVSPDHALLIDGILVHAAALVNGSSIVRETDVPESFVYYHVELDDHSLILADGVPAETFIDNVDRLAFDNWDEHERLYPEGHAILELSYPRAASARQVPVAIVRRLEARAGLVAAPVRDAA
jgi:hypothetical protein